MATLQQDTPETQEAEIERLRKDSIMLRCLEMAGVDNWSGYSHAYDIMEEYYPKRYEEMFG